MRASSLLLCVLPLLVACSSDLRIEIGVPAARDFAQPVPLMVADVQIGTTAETGLGADDRPMVVAYVDAKYKDRITRQTEFVLRRKNLGFGPRYIEVVPGNGAPVKSGHRFDARAGDPSSEAQARWNEFLERTRDPALQARMERLRARFAEMVEATQENWERERPAIEAEAKAILDQLGEESSAAARDFERWVDETIRSQERRPPE